MGGRLIQHDRGKTLGGSSSINGMVFIRGHARDFDMWRQMGCEGWSYSDVLPYFKRMENYSGGGDDFRGANGPLNVKRPDADALHPLSSAFLNAGEQAGYLVTDDISGHKQEGFGVLDRTTHNGERWSTAKAYLEPVKSRRNLRIETGVQVQRVLFNGTRATGVEIRRKSGQIAQVTADREVILSAGAVSTPHILMLSGIGPADHLHPLGIEPLADREGVGANLNEHPDFLLKFHLTEPISLYPQTKGLRQLAAGAQWLLTRDGICASNHFETVACIRSNAGVDYPDIQLTMVPLAMEAHGWDAMPNTCFPNTRWTYARPQPWAHNAAGQKRHHRQRYS
ncbi:MAG: GMC family oxidoreductase N-terminal domain-containing protein [Sulfitobacter sp.]